MSLKRFTIYFAALASCGVLAFPHWTAAHARPPAKPVVQDQPLDHVIARAYAEMHRRVMAQRHAPGE